jgi:hypothetical protein
MRVWKASGDTVVARALFSSPLASTCADFSVCAVGSPGQAYIDIIA